MKSKKAFFSLLLLFVAMLAMVQFSCKKDDGDDETKTETWNCVIDITNNRSETLYLMYGSQKVGFVGGNKSLNATIQVIGSPVTLYLKNDNGDTFCSKTLTTGDGYSVLAPADETEVEVKETLTINYSVTNKTKVELDLVYAGPAGERVLSTIPAGEKITGEKQIEETNESIYSIYLRRTGVDEKFDVMRLASGNNGYKRTIEILYFSYKITNKQSETIYGYMQSPTGDPRLFVAVSSGETKSGTTAPYYGFYGDAEYDAFTFYMTDALDNLLSEKKSVYQNEEYVVTIK